MKKFGCILIAALFGIICFMPIFAVQSNKRQTHASVMFSESDLEQKVEILSPENKNFVLAATALNNSPLDTKTKQMQPGYTITPNVDKYGQSNISFSVNSFVADANSSIYVWFYFPDTLPHDLTISFHGESSAKMQWQFSSGTLMNMLDDHGSKAFAYGWRLFELQIKDAFLDENVENVGGYTFSSMRIVYNSPSTTGFGETDSGISFYHVYMAKSFGTETHIVYYQDYANYKVKDDFSAAFENIYLYDELKISGIYEVFEYVIIGKYDLKNYSNLQNYTWSILIQDANSNYQTIKLGESYVFEYEGWYSMNIQLIENIESNSDVVLNTSHSMYCTEFKPGSFSKTDYFFELNSKNSITFDLVDNFVSESDITLTVSDKNLVDATYYVEGNVCYITVSTKQEGNCKITLEVKGRRAGTSDETTSYVSSATIYVNESGYSKSSIVLLIVIFSAFCVGLAIFLVISLVKARRFGVK